MAEEHVIELTADTFADGIKAGVVLVDFWAPWCGPCKVMSPRVAEIAEKYAGNPDVKVAKLNTDEALDLSQSLQILSIPTFITYVNGELFDRGMGVAPAPVLEQKIDQALE